jgi:Protein kinase domain
MMASYHHPNLLPLLTCFTVGDELWMVEPYVSHGSVLNIMKYHPKYRNGLPEDDIKIIMLETLKGLEYLHRHGIIHRDVKAGNILVDQVCGAGSAMCCVSRCGALHALRQRQATPLSNRCLRECASPASAPSGSVHGASNQSYINLIDGMIYPAAGRACVSRRLWRIRARREARLSGHVGAAQHVRWHALLDGARGHRAEHVRRERGRVEHGHHAARARARPRAVRKAAAVQGRHDDARGARALCSCLTFDSFA